MPLLRSAARPRGSGRAARAGRSRRPRRRSRSGSRRPASSTRSSAAAASARRATPKGSRSPSRPIPVSYLTCTRGRKPNIPARSASAAKNSARQTVSSARACRATSSSAPVSAPMTKIGTSGADPLAELERLGRGRDGEPGRAAAQRRVGALAHPVPVAVGLDDGAELGPGREPGGEGRAVALDGPEVDDRRDPLERVVTAQRARPPGSASITSPAITDSAAEPLGGDAGRRGRGRRRRRRRPRTAPFRARSARRSSPRGRRRCRRSRAPGCRAR